MDDKRDRIRFTLMRNNLSQAWLINLLTKKGIPADKVNLSDALRGVRKSERCERILDAAAELCESYERWQEGV